jgi:anthranilate synthase component 1
MRLKTFSKSLIGDLASPVGMYLRVRAQFPGSCLLESSDYRGIENSRSFIGIDPIAKIQVKDGVVVREVVGEAPETSVLTDRKELVRVLSDFLESFRGEDGTVPGGGGVFNGLVGYVSYNAVEYFEDITFSANRDPERDIPDASYALFRYIVQLNHFKSELFVSRNVLPEKEQVSEKEALESIDAITHTMLHAPLHTRTFESIGVQESNFTDEEHVEVVEKCLTHIQRGDIFQIVPSRRFSQPFTGDDFLVYRVLRAINPSPYLFYFDYGAFKLFGSSPEALITVRDGVASSYPIAGTCPRTGDDAIDIPRSKELLADPKENAEHVMLVDLARNDLSRFCEGVHVASFREVQNYSHVIHLVSRVEGVLKEKISPFYLLQATLPAGTLSGAPKYRAMEIIDSFERGHRSFYAGAVGTVSFNGDINHAIMIRSFLSKNNVLYSQAGGGVVAESNPVSEMEEVKSKLGALRSAIQKASTLFSEESESLKDFEEVSKGDERK